MTKDEEATKPTEKSAGKNTDQSTSMQTNSKQQRIETDTMPANRKVFEKKTKEKGGTTAATTTASGDGGGIVAMSCNNITANFGCRLPNGSSETEANDSQKAQKLEDEVEPNESTALTIKPDGSASPTNQIEKQQETTNEQSNAEADCFNSPESVTESRSATGAPSVTSANESDQDHQHQSYHHQTHHPNQQHHHPKQYQRAARKHQQQAQQQQMTGSSGANSGDQQVPISADYLAQLIKDKKQLGAFPSVFIHVQRLIDDEINKVRQSLFQLNDVVHQNEPLELPEPEGEFVQLQEKIYVPVEEHPEYNFVGRLLGPRGMTAKQLEQETGCKIMIRGRGSMRDKKKVSLNGDIIQLAYSFILLIALLVIWILRLMGRLMRLVG